MENVLLLHVVVVVVVVVVVAAVVVVRIQRAKHLAWHAEHGRHNSVHAKREGLVRHKLNACNICQHHDALKIRSRIPMTAYDYLPIHG